jgi:predicted metal-dependent phosphoesterase TrpH
VQKELQMSNLINLHSHSRYSDGHSTVKEMAIAAKELGFCACVITDHVYSGSFCDMSLNRNKYDMQCAEAATVSAELDYPIICGIELSVGGEEAVVIGTDAIHEIFSVREMDRDRHISIDAVKFIKEQFPCCVNLCHPGDGEKFRAAGGISILDAYEFIHTGSCMFKDRHDHYAEAGLVQLCNSDAHRANRLARCFNEADIPLITELDIIEYIKSGRTFKHVVNPYIPY